MRKLVQVVFLSKKSAWPKKWEDSQEIKDHWGEFKSIVGTYLPGKVLVVGNKAIVGVNWYLKNDEKSKAEGMKWLRENDYVAEIWSVKKEPETVGPIES